MPEQDTDYYRGDKADGITPPDLSKSVSMADHIVKARGKKSQYTSVSREPGKIRDFGEQVWRLERERLRTEGHMLVKHEELLTALRQQVVATDKAERQKALQAIRYAKMRLEGLVDWQFSTSGVDRKDLIVWAAEKVRPFFARV